jgi:hypothetical protein
MALRASQRTNPSADVQAVLKALQNKYRARRVVVDGFACDSAKEGRRWATLMQLLKAGQIRNLAHHPRFELHAPNGGVIGVYEADSAYEELDMAHSWGACVWIPVVEDVKSPVTAKLALYRWKRRHVMAEYAIQIREV